MYFRSIGQDKFIHRDKNYVFFLQQILFSGTRACKTHTKKVL